MPRKGTNVCPRCGSGGCSLIDPAALLVKCPSPRCGHEWKTRSLEARRRARRLLYNARGEN
jgi:predicted RNA-binding Zn-ribbon protein involved in translation (DUF1610 family)